MITSLQRKYIAAVALNNMGVSLLRRRLFSQAIDVFRQAVTVMREVSMVFQDAVVDPDVPSHTAQEINNMLQQASWSLFTHTGTSHRDRHPQEEVFILSEDESASVVNKCLREQHEAFICSQATSYFVRIELSGQSIRDCANADPVLEASIILMNFGNAHRRIASTCSGEQTARRYLRGAFSLCSFAHAVLQTPPPRENLQNTEEVLSYVLPISIFVLQSLICLANNLGENDQETEYRTEMSHRQDHFLSLVTVLDYSTSRNSAPAA